MGDPQELNGIARALCASRQDPLLIGSTKSNMGHPEPASGLAALAKVGAPSAGLRARAWGWGASRASTGRVRSGPRPPAGPRLRPMWGRRRGSRACGLPEGLSPARRPQVLLSLEHGFWAPNLHFHSPNPEIPALRDGRLQVVDRPLPVRGGNVAMNSFGFGGSNVHVILRPNWGPPPAPAPHAALPRLLLASGRTREAVQGLLQQGLWHGQNLAFVSMLNNIAAMPVTAMPFRGCAVLGGQGGGQEVQQVPAGQRPLWFICSGESWPGPRGRGRRVVAPA